MIENTSKTHGPFDLPVFGGSSRAIEAMEAAGQQQLVNSDRLPVDTRGTDDEFLATGFTFGEPDPDDPLFRPATLPAGWKRAATDHSMHSDIVDALGRRRVGVFYKAAFYDRRADMRLETPRSYLWSVLYNDGAPVLDDEWLTVQVVDETLAAMRDTEDERATEYDAHAQEEHRDEENKGHMRRYADEHREQAAKYEAARLRILAEASA